MSDLKDSIKFNYFYCDAGNYKVWGYEVFANPQSIDLPSIESKIRESLIDGEFFDPQYLESKAIKTW